MIMLKTEPLVLPGDDLLKYQNTSFQVSCLSRFITNQGGASCPNGRDMLFALVKVFTTHQTSFLLNTSTRFDYTMILWTLQGCALMGNSGRQRPPLKAAICHFRIHGHIPAKCHWTTLMWTVHHIEPEQIPTCNSGPLWAHSKLTLIHLQKPFFFFDMKNLLRWVISLRLLSVHVVSLAVVQSDQYLDVSRYGHYSTVVPSLRSRLHVSGSAMSCTGMRMSMMRYFPCRVNEGLTFIPTA